MNDCTGTFGDNKKSARKHIIIKFVLSDTTYVDICIFSINILHKINFGLKWKKAPDLFLKIENIGLNAQ